MNSEIGQPYSAGQMPGAVSIIFQQGVNNQINNDQISIKVRTLGTGEGVGSNPGASASTTSPASIGEVRGGVQGATQKFLPKGQKVANSHHTAKMALTISNKFPKEITVKREELTPSGFIEKLLDFFGFFETQGEFKLAKDQNAQLMDILNSLDIDHYTTNSEDRNRLMEVFQKFEGLNISPEVGQKIAIVKDEINLFTIPDDKSLRELLDCSEDKKKELDNGLNAFKKNLVRGNSYSDDLIFSYSFLLPKFVKNSIIVFNEMKSKFYNENLNETELKNFRYNYFVISYARKQIEDDKLFNKMYEYINNNPETFKGGKV